MEEMDKAVLEARIRKLEHNVREVRELALLVLLGAGLFIMFKDWRPVLIVLGFAGGVALFIKTFYAGVDRATERLNQKTATRKAVVKLN